MATNFGPYVIPASDIRVGDMVRGYYHRNVTLDTALLPSQYKEDWSDIDFRVGLLARPTRATVAGLAGLHRAVRTTRRFTEDSPVLVTREADATV